MTKYCHCCDETMCIEEFGKNGHKGRRSICKKCYNAKRREKRKKMADYLIQFFGDMCGGCGVSFPAYMYDFHHRDPAEKDRNISSMTDLSFAKVLKEVEKCNMLCPNCHRQAHYEMNPQLYYRANKELTSMS